MRSKLALDSMVFIYHFERTEPYFSRVEKILSSARDGENELITSIISVIETLSAPKYLHLAEVVDEIDLFFREADNIKVFELNGEIAFEAARLRRENKNLRTPDSIQLATALVGGAEVFITHDRGLQKMKVDKLKIRSL